MSDLVVGLALGFYIGILVDPRLRAYIANRQWSGDARDVPLLDQLVEKMREGPGTRVEAFTLEDADGFATSGQDRIESGERGG